MQMYYDWPPVAVWCTSGVKLPGLIRRADWGASRET